MTRLGSVRGSCPSELPLTEWRGADPGLADSLAARPDSPPERLSRLPIIADPDWEAGALSPIAEGAALLALGGAAATSSVGGVLAGGDGDEGCSRSPMGAEPLDLARVA